MQTDTIGDVVRQELRPLGQLWPNPLNPRREISMASIEELAMSIRALGVLQPLLVTPDGTIVAGHRRYAAAVLVGLTEVPVVVRTLSEAEQLTCMLTENLQRADLTPLEEARAYQNLRQRGIGKADIARQIGIPASRVTERLLILQLDPLVQELLDRGELPTGLIRPLAKVTDPAMQRHLASASAKRLLSAAQIVGLVEREKPALQAKPERQARPVAPAGTSRAAALARLAERERMVAPFVAIRTLSEAMEGACSVCDTCGCEKMDVICNVCPLPAYVLKVLR